MSKVNVILGEERIISMAPVEIRDWGPWQFPNIYKGANNELYLSFHIAQDSYSAYGCMPAYYISHDLGQTWEPTKTSGGLCLDNRTMIKPATTHSLNVEDIELPEVLANTKNCYVDDGNLYDIDKIKDEYKKWYKWVIDGDKEYKKEILVNAPGYLMRETTGMLITPFFYIGYFFRKDEDTIIALSYHPLQDNMETTSLFNALYFESKDNGESFNLISSIRYLPPYDKIPDSMKMQGWLEPTICFLDENTAFTLLRTTCKEGIRPLYIAYSYDGLRTWTKPEFFDDKGVFPQAIKLNNGIVLTGYGRTGLYVRAMCDGQWDARVEVVKPLDFQTDTCSYCGLVSTGENSALIVYSRFDVKDDDGNIRKAIICRDITLKRLVI